MKRLSAAVCFFIGLTTSIACFAQDGPRPFEAICKADDYHTYFESSDEDGYWRTSGETNLETPWQIVYSGNDSVELDGKRYALEFRSPEMFLFTSLGATDIAAGGSLYVMNLKMRTVVVGFVNTWTDSFSSALQGAITILKCDVTFEDEH